ncbi:hypothetical protein [Proteus mirabilis]|uniref:hypothetical protein n=1 Tax=Proteus mirabilis TaxID=584 RepID=UPI0034D49D37
MENQKQDQTNQDVSFAEVAQVVKNNVELMNNMNDIEKAIEVSGLSEQDKKLVREETRTAKESINKDMSEMNTLMADTYFISLEETLQQSELAIKNLQEKEVKTEEDVNEIFRLELLRDNINHVFSQDITILHFASNLPENLDQLFAIPNTERKYATFGKYCRSRNIKFVKLERFFSCLRKLSAKDRGKLEGHLVYLYALFDLFEKMDKTQREQNILFFRISIELFMISYAQNKVYEGLNQFMIDSLSILLAEKNKRASQPFTPPGAIV